MWVGQGEQDCGPQGAGTLIKHPLYAGPNAERFKKVHKKRKMQPLPLMVSRINGDSIVLTFRGL